MTENSRRLRADLDRVLRGGVSAIDPVPLVAAAARAQFVSTPHPLFVIAAGKAAYGMARGLAAAGVAVEGGLVAGPAPARLQLASEFQWLDAAHPNPDDTSVEAAARALALAARSRGRTLAVLLSGGASSMLALPAPGIKLEDKIAAGRALMRAGVGIAELNAVRKHLSSIKGGQLAAAASACVTLAISDVHGPVEDDPSVIGSGPTVADPTTFAEALRVVRESGAEVPARVTAHLAAGVRGEVDETPKPGDARLARSTFEVIANRRTAMDGAAAAARALGYDVVVCAEATSGEASVAGREFARLALAHRGAAPLCVIASGETTVRVAGPGAGGRNQEFVLAAALEIEGQDGIALASAGTDGIDGPTNVAGGVADGSSARRAREAGTPIEPALAANDSYAVLAALGDHVCWGRTGTNTGDLHVLLMA